MLNIAKKDIKVRNKKEIEVKKANKRLEKAWEKLSDVMEEIRIGHERCKSAMYEVNKAREELGKTRKIR